MDWSKFLKGTPKVTDPNVKLADLVVSAKQELSDDGSVLTVQLKTLSGEQLPVPVQIMGLKRMAETLEREWLSYCKDQGVDPATFQSVEIAAVEKCDDPECKACRIRAEIKGDKPSGI